MTALSKFGFQSLPVLCVCLMASQAQALGERVDKSVEVVSTGTVSVSVPRGELRITGWDEPEVRLQGTLDSETGELIFRSEGDLTRIHVVTPDALNHGTASQLTLRVPKRSHLSVEGGSTDIKIHFAQAGLEVTTASGDIEVQDGSGDITVKSASGDLEVERHLGNANLHTVSGEVDIEELEGDLLVNAASGDIEAEATAAHVELNSASGEIELVNHGVCEQADIQTVSGDMDLSLNPSADAKLTMTSASGDVTLKLPEATQAQFELNTHASGDISNELTDDRVSGKETLGQNLAFRMGDGGAQVQLTSQTGDLRLRKREP